MKIVPLEKQENKDAVDLLEETIERVKSGEIRAVTVVWVTNTGIGGDTSSGENQILMYAALEHQAKVFHQTFIQEPDENQT